MPHRRTETNANSGFIVIFYSVSVSVCHRAYIHCFNEYQWYIIWFMEISKLNSTIYFLVSLFWYRTDLIFVVKLNCVLVYFIFIIFRLPASVRHFFRFLFGKLFPRIFWKLYFLSIVLLVVNRHVHLAEIKNKTWSRRN